MRGRICSPRLVLLAAAFPFAGSTALASTSETGTANREPIALPEVVVSGRTMEQERWRVAETANYRILTDGSESLLRHFARVLDESALVAAAIWPGPAATPNPPKLTLILCDTSKSFRRFVPAKVGTEVSLDFVDRLSFGPADDHLLIFACSQRANESLQRSLLRSYARRVLANASKPPPPEWFVTGMAEIIAYASVADKPNGERVTFGQVEGPNGPIPAQPPLPLYASIHLTPDIRDVIDGSLDEKTLAVVSQDEDEANSSLPGERVSFSQYFTVYPYHHELADVLANQPSISPDEYRMTCWAFVHLCAFGQPKLYRAGFEKLLRLLAEKPDQPFNDLVKPCFKISAHTLETEVASYTRSAASAGAAKLVPSLVVPELNVREASREEIARFKIRAYTLANRLDAAKIEQSKLEQLEAKKRTP